MKATSKAVKDSRAASGIRSTSIYLSEAEHARWKAVAKARGASLKDTLIAGLDALEAAGDPTPDQALAVLQRFVRARR